MGHYFDVAIPETKLQVHICEGFVEGSEAMDGDPCFQDGFGHEEGVVQLHPGMDKWYMVKPMHVLKDHKNLFSLLETGDGQQPTARMKKIALRTFCEVNPPVLMEMGYTKDSMAWLLVRIWALKADKAGWVKWVKKVWAMLRGAANQVMTPTEILELTGILEMETITSPPLATCLLNIMKQHHGHGLSMQTLFLMPKNNVGWTTMVNPGVMQLRMGSWRCTEVHGVHECRKRVWFDEQNAVVDVNHAAICRTLDCDCDPAYVSLPSSREPKNKKSNSVNMVCRRQGHDDPGQREEVENPEGIWVVIQGMGGTSCP